MRECFERERWSWETMARSDGFWLPLTHKDVSRMKGLTCSRGDGMGAAQLF